MLFNLTNLIKKYDLNINGVIHIGAHYGEEHKIYVDNAIENQIFFEPIKKNFEILKSNVGDKYQLYNLALGNENRQIEMYVETNNRGMSSSVLKPSLHLKQYPYITFDETEIVDMRRLDDMEIDLTKFNFINIDVQGYELEVFKGSKKTLENIQYIMTEINRDELYSGCVQIGELIEFLSKFGFELVEETWDGGTWGDGFFIKK